MNPHLFVSRAPALNHCAVLPSSVRDTPSGSDKLTCDDVAPEDGLRVPSSSLWWILSGARWRKSKSQFAFTQLGQWAKGDPGPLGNLATKGNDCWAYVTARRPRRSQGMGEFIEHPLCVGSITSRILFNFDNSSIKKGIITPVLKRERTEA